MDDIESRVKELESQLAEEEEVYAIPKEFIHKFGKEVRYTRDRTTGNFVADSESDQGIISIIVDTCGGGRYVLFKNYCDALEKYINDGTKKK